METVKGRLTMNDTQKDIEEIKEYTRAKNCPPSPQDLVWLIEQAEHYKHLNAAHIKQHRYSSELEKKLKEKDDEIDFLLSREAYDEQQQKIMKMEDKIDKKDARIAELEEALPNWHPLVINK